MALSSTFTAADGDGYAQLMGRWSRRLAPRFVAFSGVNGGDILDVGCGTGNLASCLAQYPNTGSVVGIDFSAVYVDHAKRHNLNPRVTFVVGDACALPFETAAFDHSLSMLVLQFIPDAAKALREMRRVTRPGGTVAAATWDNRGGFVTYRMFFDTAAMIDPGAVARREKAYTRPLTRPGELERAWHEAGLVDVEQDMTSIRMDFASFADFWAPVEGKDGPLADYFGSLAADMQQDVCAAVQSAYLDGETDGPRSYVATAWVVKGTVPK